MKYKTVIFLTVIFISNYILAQDKHSLFTELLRSSVKNGLVDYKNLKNDNRLEEYINYLEITELGALDNKNDSLAHWINIYNAYTLKLIKDAYPVESINDLHKGGLILGQVLGTTIWHYELINIGSHKYSLNDIEHEIIRKQFNEPRIHFALVCAAISCPPLLDEAYEGYKLDDQLQDQTTKFFLDKSKNVFNIMSRTAVISKIMDWYEEDFGDSEEEVLLYISNFLDKEARFDIINNLTEWEIEFMSYDWSLNEIDPR